MRRPDGSTRAEPIGPLLARLRTGRGWSQQQLAGTLCQVAGRVTVTRHEVSRWERGQRVPSPFWLDSLAAALTIPQERLEAAVHATRQPVVVPGTRPVGRSWLWRPLVALDLLAMLDHGGSDDLRELAHAWLAGPPDGWDAGPEPVPVGGAGRDVLGLWEAGLGRLRRDDLLGGMKLARNVDHRLREVIPVLKTIGNQAGALRSRALRLIAGYAQLAGWVHADAGHGPAASRAYRVGLKAACVAGDRQLAAHVLGSLSNLSLDAGNAHDALLLARTGLAGIAGRGDSPRLRALLLHRAALAAARLGEKREAEVTLAEAERLADTLDPEDEPEWLRWLDNSELQAMAGRCLVVLGRPVPAVRLLTGAHGDGKPRRSALYRCWLARAYAALGELEEAGRIARRAQTDVAASGSVRAARALRHLVRVNHSAGVRREWCM